MTNQNWRHPITNDMLREVRVLPGKVKAVRFDLERVEGRHSECVKVSVTTWAGADSILRQWAHTAPDDGSYHKCDFKVHYADGETYEGRFDLKRHDVTMPEALLFHHMWMHVTYHAGCRKPDWMTVEQYLTARAEMNPQTVAEYVAFLYAYEIGEQVQEVL